MDSELSSIFICNAISISNHQYCIDINTLNIVYEVTNKYYFNLLCLSRQMFSPNLSCNTLISNEYQLIYNERLTLISLAIANVNQDHKYVYILSCVEYSLYNFGSV